MTKQPAAGYCVNCGEWSDNRIPTPWYGETEMWCKHCYDHSLDV